MKRRGKKLNLIYKYNPARVRKQTRVKTAPRQTRKGRM